MAIGASWLRRPIEGRELKGKGQKGSVCFAVGIISLAEFVLKEGMILPPRDRLLFPPFYPGPEKQKAPQGHAALITA